MTGRALVCYAMLDIISFYPFPMIRLCLHCAVFSGCNTRQYHQYLDLTFLVQAGLDQGDWELPFSEEGEVSLQHQDKLLSVPLLECQQQILKINLLHIINDIFYIFLAFTSLSGSFRVISTFLWTSSSLETLILLTVWISHKFWGWKRKINW